MSRTARVALALLLSCASISPAAATVYIFTGTATGDQEVPPTGSPGTGNVVVTFDDVAHSMQVQASFADLLANTTAAHIHVGMPTGGVATTLPSFPGFPLGVTSGSFDNIFDMTMASSYNPAFVTNNGGTTATAEAALLAALLGGQAYFNIHTEQFPGGEIRANLTAVPEPGTWLMMLLGFGAAGVALRWRKRAEPLPA